MKGQTGIELAILAIMGLVGVIAIYIPPIIYKTSATINLQYEYNYDNSQLLMTSLMATTVQDSMSGIVKTSMEVLGEYIQFQDEKDKLTPPDISAVKPIGDKIQFLTDNSGLECYKLSASSGDIVKSSCDASKYKISTLIPLPYKPDYLTKEITMVVGK